MLRPTLLLLLLLSLSFTTPTHAQADSLLYVKPTEDTKCPSEPCHTLDEYVNETHHHEYFPYNNTVMKFLPGTHNLSEVFQFHGATNLTLEATDSTVNGTLLSCSDNHQSLNFTHGSQISIQWLSIMNCHSKHGTLFFHNSAYVRISSVVIQPLHLYNDYAIYAHFVHSINLSWVSIHLPHNGQAHNGIIFLFDVSGNCVFEQVDIIGPGHNVTALGIHVETNIRTQFIIRNCTFEQNVQYYSSSSDRHLQIVFENIIFRHITGDAPLILQQLYVAKNNTDTAIILRNVTFASNRVFTGRKIRLAGAMDILHIENVTFIDCEFYDNVGTAIVAVRSALHFSGTIVFRNNTGYDGGAMSFAGGSYVYISNDTNVVFENNKAENAGGAVFVNQDATYHCFFRQSPEDPCNLPCSIPFNLSFINNTAQKGGDAMYEADMSNCMYCHLSSCTGEDLVSHTPSGLYLEPSFDSDPSQISSDPIHVCLCEHRKINCSITTRNETHYPGEEFTISAVNVGDMQVAVAGTVYAQLLPQYIEAILGELQHFQEVTPNYCTELKYTILSKPGLVGMTLTLSSDRILGYEHEENTKRHVVYFNITLLPCPLGFYLSDYPHQCICDTKLKSNNIPCNITTQTIRRSGTVWVNASFDGNISDGVIVHKDCPFGYCKTEEVGVNLKHPETQCAFNHSGTLCGACQPGLSLALGSPQCLSHCSNGYISLIIAFAIAGLVLVLFIKILDLTVALGTINGLIFYANIIQAAQSTFLPAGDANPLTVFIAWLNLDLGIETCFCHGLDGYWKTWLQFVFPFYIWAIILLIIYLSRHSQTVARIFGNNSVPVLATLILLSYTKLLRTIVSALTFTYLEFPDGSRRAVWSFDGNIPYLGLKHIPLFLVALGVLLFLWLPLTVLLLFEQCFQRIGTYTVRKWMLRLKPFFDAYFGPLRGNHRYWVGVLLVARGILLLVFGPLNSANDPSVNLLAVNTVIVLLLMYTSYLPQRRTDVDGGNHFRFWIGSCYKKWYLSLLESSFLCNLAVLSAITLAKGKQAAVVYTSVGITFCQFIGIVVYQVYIIIRRSWPPEAPYRRMDQCREPLLEEN